MYPHLVRIGDFTVTSFGVMMFLAFVVGAWVLARQFRARGIDPEHAWDMLLWIALGGVIGAKLYYIGLHPDDFVASPFRELVARGGLVWYGGFIGGVAALLWQARKRGLPLAGTFDSAAPALALAYAIGRIGCFLVGDDYGRPTSSWVGVAFPDGYPPSTAGYFRSIGTHIPAEIPNAAVLAVHPTQLYEVGLALVMFAILVRLSGRVRPGRLFATYLVLYGVERFMIEFLRAKTDHVVAGLTTSQLASLALLGIAAVIWVRTAAPDPSVDHEEPAPVPAGGVVEHGDRQVSDAAAPDAGTTAGAPAAPGAADGAAEP
jgi:phosphatidylglycerol---prolipoprotein diacylglyceryl transferase